MSGWGACGATLGGTLSCYPVCETGYRLEENRPNSCVNGEYTMAVCEIDDAKYNYVLSMLESLEYITDDMKEEYDEVVNDYRKYVQSPDEIEQTGYTLLKIKELNDAWKLLTPEQQTSLASRPILLAKLDNVDQTSITSLSNIINDMETFCDYVTCEGDDFKEPLDNANRILGDIVQVMTITYIDINNAIKDLEDKIPISMSRSKSVLDYNTIMNNIHNFKIIYPEYGNYNYESINPDRVGHMVSSVMSFEGVEERLKPYTSAEWIRAREERKEIWEHAKDYATKGMAFKEAVGTAVNKQRNMLEALKDFLIETEDCTVCERNENITFVPGIKEYVGGKYKTKRGTGIWIDDGTGEETTEKKDIDCIDFNPAFCQVKESKWEDFKQYSEDSELVLHKGRVVDITLSDLREATLGNKCPDGDSSRYALVDFKEFADMTALERGQGDRTSKKNRQQVSQLDVPIFNDFYKFHPTQPAPCVYTDPTTLNQYVGSMDYYQNNPRCTYSDWQHDGHMSSARQRWQTYEEGVTLDGTLQAILPHRSCGGYKKSKNKDDAWFSAPTVCKARNTINDDEGDWGKYDPKYDNCKTSRQPLGTSLGMLYLSTRTDNDIGKEDLENLENTPLLGKGETGLYKMSSWKELKYCQPHTFDDSNFGDNSIECTTDNSSDYYYIITHPTNKSTYTISITDGKDVVRSCGFNTFAGSTKMKCGYSRGQYGSVLYDTYGVTPGHGDKEFDIDVMGRYENGDILIKLKNSLPWPSEHCKLVKHEDVMAHQIFDGDEIDCKYDEGDPTSATPEMYFILHPIVEGTNT